METFDTRRDDDLLTRGSQFANSLRRHHQLFMDRITPFLAARWIFSAFVLLLFLLRVVIGEGWYVICYALGIYYLNLLIDFLSPKMDPDFQASQEDLDPDSGPALPTRVNDEFRPFIRRLPEYKFWFLGTRATLVSLILSMFDMLDLPVFWPILLLYFFILTFLTLRRQIQHMYKFHYVPWTTGKRRYGQGRSGCESEGYSLREDFAYQISHYIWECIHLIGRHCLRVACFYRKSCEPEKKTSTLYYIHRPTFC